jgi:nucleotidyltransferase/DNA polymerase involved in DNA repair
MQNADKVILHFDMDCFYCQVEARRLGVPASTPLVVDQWGMLLSVNYPAKAIGITRKTPAKDAAAMGAIVAHVRVVDIETGEKFDDINSAYRDRTLYKASLDRYRDASEEVMIVMKQALPPGAVFERASIDECFIDLSGQDLLDMFEDISDVEKLRWEGGGGYEMTLRSDNILARGALLGERIRSEVLSVTGFTVSCGVSLTRQVAKLSCALNKPNKLTVVPTHRTTEFMRTVPLKEIRGLGPRAMETLQARVPWVQGSTKCGDLWQVDLGRDEFATWIYDALRGLNDDQVKETSLTAGSVQSSKQFRPPLPLNQLESLLHSLTVDMISRLEGRKAKTLVVTLQVGDIVRTRQDRYPTGGSVEQIDELVRQLSMKTGLINPSHPGFDRIAVTAKDVDEQGAKTEVAEYLSASRLHFMGTWKTRYLQYVAEVEETSDWGPGELSIETSNSLSDFSEHLFDANNSISISRYLLVDMDCFFCSVSMAVKGINESVPCAVASGLGPTSEICSANYAARKFGISASSFVSTAREKCPQIQILAIDPPTLSRCENIWKKVIHILYLVAGRSFDRVQGRSCDEALIDLSSANITSPDLIDLGKRIQHLVVQECGVPCSVGIAPTRILAKLATSKAKPKGVRVISTIEEGVNIISGDPIKSLPGIGYSTHAKLTDVGIDTVGDLLRSSEKLPGLLGPGIAKKLIATAQGQDVDEDNLGSIQPLTVSAEKNFGLRNLSLEQARDLLEALCGAAQARCPPKAIVEKAVLKLKLAGDDWVEPAKKGGIGAANDWSRSVDISTTTSVFPPLAAMLKDIDTVRIRGIGVALKLKPPPQSVPARGAGGTLEQFFSKQISTSNRTSPARESRKRSLDDDSSAMMVTSACIVCGLDILPGHLSKHFATHLGNEDCQVCPCPICLEPIELSDTSHVSSHFILPS